jgi:hypothetical protein
MSEENKFDGYCLDHGTHSIDPKIGCPKCEKPEVTIEPEKWKVDLAILLARNKDCNPVSDGFFADVKDFISSVVASERKKWEEEWADKIKQAINDTQTIEELNSRLFRIITTVLIQE